MSPQRAACLESMKKNIRVPIEFLGWKDWAERILPEAPLHPGFRYLSCNHKADYLRCYFMHHFGGGYADIKHYTSQNNWDVCFDIMNALPQIQVIGVPEIMGGSSIGEYNNVWIIQKLLSNGWFICRSRSNFTSAWYARLMCQMDKYLPSLMRHPAIKPMSREGQDGYPVPWAAMQGEIFHKTIMDFRKKNPESICSALQTGCEMGIPYR